MSPAFVPAAPPPEFPKYYELEGIPVRRRGEAHPPEKLTPDGRWVPLLDPERFATKASPVPPEEAAGLVDGWLRSFSRGG